MENQINMDEQKQAKILAQLKSSYDMYETTKKQTEKRMKEQLNADGTKKYTKDKIDEEINLITEAQNDVVAQYVMCGGKEEDIRKKTKKKTANLTKEGIAKTIADMVNEMDNDRKDALDKAISVTATNIEKTYIPTSNQATIDAAFDVIPLPSKGEGYKDKIGKVSVSYLTAWDENMIVSPNMYKGNLILDYILNEKLLSKEIEPIDLLEGDRDAILLFLRATGYGNKYPITATDNVSGKEFDAVIDLSKLKYKEFNLVGDSNGWFSFTLPTSKKEVKFRFPTHRDNVILEKMQTIEDKEMKKNSITEYAETLTSFIDSDKDMKDEDKITIRQAINTIEKWGESIDIENPTLFNHTLTNRLNLLIMAIDGITDKGYIEDFIKKMNVRDSSALRTYIAENEPGIDYNVTIDRPQSLGGGSFTTFLQLDKFLFLNIAE